MPHTVDVQAVGFYFIISRISVLGLSQNFSSFLELQTNISCLLVSYDMIIKNQAPQFPFFTLLSYILYNAILYCTVEIISLGTKGAAIGAAPKVPQANVAQIREITLQVVTSH